MKGLHVLFSQAADAMGIAPFYSFCCKYKTMHWNIHPVPENDTFFASKESHNSQQLFRKWFYCFAFAFFFPFILRFEDVTRWFCRHFILVFVQND